MAFPMPMMGMPMMMPGMMGPMAAGGGGGGGASGFKFSKGTHPVVMSYGGRKGGRDDAVKLRSQICKALGYSDAPNDERVYMDYFALRNKPGTTTETSKDKDDPSVTYTWYKNPNWAAHYKAAITDCYVFLFQVDEGWCASFGAEEWDNTAKFAKEFGLVGNRIPIFLQRDTHPSTVAQMKKFSSMRNPADGQPLIQNGCLAGSSLRCVFQKGEEMAMIKSIQAGIQIMKGMGQPNPMMNPMMMGMNPMMMGQPPCCIQ